MDTKSSEKTTLYLPSDVMLALRMEAARTRLSMSDIVADALRERLASEVNPAKFVIRFTDSDPRRK